jgi:predicted flap endonuclease-1-like 5' DNA nuclease
MKILQKRVVLLLACAPFLVTAAAGMASAAQTKADSSKAKAVSEQKTAATIDLNTASEKDLDSLPGVGPATAKKIIAGRPYSSVDGLSKAGVSAVTIKKITPLVTANAGTAAAVSSESNKKSAVKTDAKAAAPASQPQPTPAVATQPATAAPPKTLSPATSRGTPGPGNVWVNLDSGVYHYPSSRYYGKTKSGKYMSESDAEKAGYHAAKDEKKPQ